LEARSRAQPNIEVKIVVSVSVVVSVSNVFLSLSSLLCRDEHLAEEVLAVYPFCDLVHNYWVLCRRVYNAFLVIHVLFMALFTVYVMPSTAFLAARFAFIYFSFERNC